MVFHALPACAHSAISLWLGLHQRQYCARKQRANLPTRSCRPPKRPKVFPQIRSNCAGDPRSCAGLRQGPGAPPAYSRRPCSSVRCSRFAAAAIAPLSIPTACGGCSSGGTGMIGSPRQRPGSGAGSAVRNTSARSTLSGSRPPTSVSAMSDSGQRMSGPGSGRSVGIERERHVGRSAWGAGCSPNDR